MAEDAALENYLQAASAWEADRLRAAQDSARRAWRVAVAASCVGLCGLGTAATLAPLKTVVPYLIRVDSTTGVVDVVPPVTTAVAPTEAVTRHLLNLYVTARERYVADLAPNDYALVGSMQSAQLNQKLLHDWDRNNPESPINRHRDGSAVVVRVHSITFLRHEPGGSEVAQVRFSTVLRPASGAAEQLSPWIATLAYRFGPVSKDSAERETNPLGLRVSEYQREPEVVATPVSGTGS